MEHKLESSPWRVLLPVGLGTGLSLMGDTSLYAVLPTHFKDAAVPLVTVGILLSVNRIIRLALNTPFGILYDRSPRRRIFVPALFLGAISTAIYALTVGFWPLLVGRLLWGIAWVGIWVGGNTIVLDISNANNRGRRVGVYQISFFLGASGGAVLGGVLTDGVGYHWAMGIGALLTLFGAISALLFLPETRNLREAQNVTDSRVTNLAAANAANAQPTHWAELVSAIGLLGVNRLVIPGILMSTFGLLVLEQVGESTQIAGLTLGVATLTGIALGVNALVSMVAAPVIGGLSDQTGSRWRVAAGGLLPGIAGFCLLAFASPLALFLGMPLTAISGGSNQSLSTALVGDLSPEQRRGKRLGILFTVGDLASAIGPPLAYGLIPLLGLSSLYLLSAGLFGLMFLVASKWAILRLPC